MRRLLCALLIAVPFAGGVLVASGSPATAATSPASAYVSVAPQRLLDTRSTSPVAAKGTLSLVVPSSVVPADAAAVVLNVTVTGAKAGGYLTAFPAGQARPTASNLNFSAGQTVPNLVVSALGTGRGVDFYNGSAGTTQLVVDLAGYYAAPVPAGVDQQGFFDPLSPTRLLDTRNGTGAPRAAVGAHATLDLAVAGQGSVPTGISAVLLNVTVTGATAAGYVTAYPDGPVRPTASSVNFPAGKTVPNLVLAAVGADGHVELYNGSSGTVQLVADVSGYLLAGDPVRTGGTGALTPARLLDTRSSTAIGAGKTRVLAVAGHGGVPASRVSAVVVNLTATRATSGGAITVYGSGTAPTTSNLNYGPSQTIANLASVKLAADGSLTIYNRSSGTVQLLVDVVGYVTSADAPLPGATTSRYVTDLTKVGNAGSLGEACADAKQTPGLVLLDVGAQTVTSPLSPTNPGVALVFSNPTQRYSYGDLVTALDAYLDGFAACMAGGQQATIAVGTNNSGVFTGANAYPATTRGADWANQVVDALAAHPGITIAGANDIESNFASTESQAEDWVRSFLASTNVNLVDNGAATNCPTTFDSSADCGPVLDDNGQTKTWTRANYVSLTYGLGPTRIRVLPQIYFASQAAQWRNIDVTAGSRLNFAGSLTQYGVCGGSSDCGFAPSQGWAALYHALSTRSTPPALPVASDLSPS